MVEVYGRNFAADTGSIERRRICRARDNGETFRGGGGKERRSVFDDRFRGHSADEIFRFLVENEAVSFGENISRRSSPDPDFVEVQSQESSEQSLVGEVSGESDEVAGVSHHAVAADVAVRETFGEDDRRNDGAFRLQRPNSGDDIFGVFWFFASFGTERGRRYRRRGRPRGCGARLVH